MNQDNPNSPTEDDLAFGRIDLARVVLAGSRPLERWERESLDEFTWAELSADFSEQERIKKKKSVVA